VVLLLTGYKKAVEGHDDGKIYAFARLSAACSRISHTKKQLLQWQQRSSSTGKIWPRWLSREAFLVDKFQYMKILLVFMLDRHH